MTKSKDVDYSTQTASPQEWRDESGAFHRDDGPALITGTGCRFWFCHGKLHRADGPAILRPLSGRWMTKPIEIEAWYIDDVLHREDGPAVTMSNGAKSWYLHGVLQPNPDE